MFLYDDEKPKVEGLMTYVKAGKSLRNTVGDIWKTKFEKDLELIWTDSPLYDENGEVTQIMSFGTDITDHKNLVRRLNDLAYYDVLTKLPNKILLKNKMGKFISEAKHNKAKLAFLYIDLDNFKQINDTLGHECGDEFLIALAENLKKDKEKGDYLAKLSEDEYAVVLNGIISSEDIINRTKNILDSVNKPWGINGSEFQISASIGISIYPDDGKEYSSLLKHANMAMYRVKEMGKNGYTFYHDEMGRKIAENTFLINQINRAIEEEHFILHYQPIMDIETNELYGIEALLRWHHPERGSIPPLDYIPLIEETGQIADVTNLVFKMALMQKRQWNEKGYKDLKISINISTKSLVKGGLDKGIMELLEKYGVEPNEIILEITETSFMDDLEKSLLTLKKLQSLGIAIALDDFGTGYSSLSQLRALPVTYVKIDQGFIRTMKRHSEEEVVVKAIIELGHSLGLKIIVEGIETEEQKDILIESKCDLGQGYFMAKPMDVQDFEKMFLQIKR